MTATTADTTWEMVVGLEVHVQLKTRTKAFCACSTEFGAHPNSNVCPVCLGLPGALPVLNEHAVELAVRAALALNCRVNPASVFVRKNYFDPDLPSGYQITQLDQPLACDGYLVIGTRTDRSPVRIGITRIHIEEDAGKSLHDRYVGHTAIDLNRAGTPLIEIVSEPDLRTREQVGAYLRLLKQTLEYMTVSDVSMEEGRLRVDANVSVRRRGETELGTRTEVKNLNSFSAVERAVEAELLRQSALIAGGGRVQQETLLWDGTALRPGRVKEGSEDYRYFPEPNLPPLILAGGWIAHMRSTLPEMPGARRVRFATVYKLSENTTNVLTANPAVSDYYESVVRAHGDPQTAAKWVMGDVLGQVRARGTDIFAFSVRPADLGQLLDLIRDGVVTDKAAKRIFARMMETGDPPVHIAEREGLLQVGDEDQLSQWLDEAMAELPEETERLRSGERRLVGVLIGAAVRRSGGRADPRTLTQLLAARLGT